MNADDLTTLVTELHRRFPRFRRATIERLAARVAAQYRDAPVQEFIPILVQRQAADQLHYAESIGAPDAQLMRRWGHRRVSPG